MEGAAEVEESFDAVAEGQADFHNLTDELAVCVSEKERVAAMLFFLDARYLPPSQVVTLHGLASKPELNGKRAVICRAQASWQGSLSSACARSRWRPWGERRYAAAAVLPPDC